MISSWRFLAVAGTTTAERDLDRLKANDDHRRQIYKKLDKVVEAMNAGGQPFAPSSAVKGTNSLEIIAQSHCAYRLFLRRLSDKLVVLGIEEGGGETSTKSETQEDILNRLKILQEARPRLVKPKPLPDPTPSRRSTRSSNAGREQAEQAKGNVSAVVFRGRGLRSAKQITRVARQAPKTMGQLLTQYRSLNASIDLAQPREGVRLTGQHHRVQQAVAVAKADNRDLVAEWKRERTAVETEIDNRGLASSPLPKEAPRRERVNAGVRFLLEAETSSHTRDAPGLSQRML